MNRIEDARKSLQRIRAGVFTDEEIDAEFQDLRRGLEKEVEKGKFIELFQGLNLKRTAIVVGVNFFQQVTGQAFSSQYGSIYVKSLGTVNPFKFSLITSGIGMATMIFMLLLTDKFGRRYTFPCFPWRKALSPPLPPSSLVLLTW